MSLLDKILILRASFKNLYLCSYSYFFEKLLPKVILRNLKYILSYSYLCTHECVPRYSMVYRSVNPFFSMPVELIGVSGEATNARTYDKNYYSFSINFSEPFDTVRFETHHTDLNRGPCRAAAAGNL